MNEKLTSNLLREKVIHFTWLIYNRMFTMQKKWELKNLENYKKHAQNVKLLLLMNINWSVMFVKMAKPQLKPHFQKLNQRKKSNHKMSLKIYGINIVVV